MNDRTFVWMAPLLLLACSSSTSPVTSSDAGSDAPHADAHADAGAAASNAFFNRTGGTNASFGTAASASVVDYVAYGMKDVRDINIGEAPSSCPDAFHDGYASIEMKLFVAEPGGEGTLAAGQTFTYESDPRHAWLFYGGLQMGCDQSLQAADSSTVTITEVTANEVRGELSWVFTDGTTLSGRFSVPLGCVGTPNPTCVKP